MLTRMRSVDPPVSVTSEEAGASWITHGVLSSIFLSNPAEIDDPVTAKKVYTPRRKRDRLPFGVSSDGSD